MAAAARAVTLQVAEQHPSEATSPLLEGVKGVAVAAVVLVPRTGSVRSPPSHQIFPLAQRMRKHKGIPNNAPAISLIAPVAL